MALPVYLYIYTYTMLYGDSGRREHETRRRSDLPFMRNDLRIARKADDDRSILKWRMLMDIL